MKRPTLRKWMMITIIRLLIFPFETMDINVQAIAEWEPVKTFISDRSDRFDEHGIHNIQNIPDKIHIKKIPPPGLRAKSLRSSI